MSENNDNKYKTLKEIGSILDSLNIPFFLVCGVLLGYHREKNFIEHDPDIDISVFIKDYTPKIKEKILENGFEFIHSYGNLHYGFEYAFNKYDVKIDIIFCYYDKNKDIYYLNVWERENDSPIPLYRMYRYNYFKFNLINIDFNGIPVKIPDDTEKMIKLHYGENWNIIKRKWNFYQSPLCVEKTELLLPMNNYE